MIFCPSTGLVYLAQWSLRENGLRLEGVTSSFARSAMHSDKKWRTELWLNAMRSGKK